MKINLSKEHIEKGCELVEGYSLRIDDSVRGDFKEHLRYKGFRENIENSDSPLYRDFLQLIIEGINSKSNTWNIEQSCDMIEIYNAEKFNNRAHIIRLNRNITEAKEKAIAYVLDNMEI